MSIPSLVHFQLRQSWFYSESLTTATYWRQYKHPRNAHCDSNWTQDHSLAVESCWDVSNEQMATERGKNSKVHSVFLCMILEELCPRVGPLFRCSVCVWKLSWLHSSTMFSLLKHYSDPGLQQTVIVRTHSFPNISVYYLREKCILHLDHVKLRAMPFEELLLNCIHHKILF